MVRIKRLLTGKAMLVIASFFGGALVGSVATGETAEGPGLQPAPAGYLIALTEVPVAGTMTAYAEALAVATVGTSRQVLARSAQVEVLEGEFPREKRLLVEQFSSLDALRDFWNSPEYEEAKRLREGRLGVDFVIAVEGVAP